MAADTSLRKYREEIEATLGTYERSLRSWRLRKVLFDSMLETWSKYDSLRSNPVDQLRIEFMDGEIDRQQQKLEACRQNLKKFQALEEQLLKLSQSMPIPDAEETASAHDDVVMDICEELDENDRIIAATVTPQNAHVLDQFPKSLNSTSRDVGIEGQDVNGVLNDKIINSGDIPATEDHASFEPPPIPTSSINSKIRKKKKKKSTSSASPITDANTHDVEASPVSDEIVERNMSIHNGATFGIVETADGQMEITDDPDGYSIGVLPQGLAEMTSIVNEMDWDNSVEIDEDEESEDEFGRTKHRGLIPLPGMLQRPASSQESRIHLVERDRRNSAEKENITDTSARSTKKKLIFADKLVQGPSAGVNKAQPRSVLKKVSAYPITAELDTELSLPTPTIQEPKKSRFKMERSSTDTKIALLRHAQPSQSDQQKIDAPISQKVVERTPDASVMGPADEAPIVAVEGQKDARTLEARDNLYPNKINLAGIDLAPEDGTVKSSMNIPKLTHEELNQIRKKREAMGKKHRRRKSADPNYPVRSSSWDESQPQPLPRRLSSGETEESAESLKNARIARARELLRAQDDIAWANSPISPDDVRDEKPSAEINPMAEAGKDILAERHEARHTSAINHASESVRDAVASAGSTAANSVSAESRVSPQQATESTAGNTATSNGQSQPPQSYPTGLLSPRPRKPPTPERRGSYTNIPSPLSQEIQPHNLSREVQFTSDVIQKLEPLMEDNSEPTVVVSARKERKMPPRQPLRKSSIDPQTISPTPGSPPPENRQPGPLRTEEEGSVSHYMVRATSKSPPPHIAIHDLLGDTPESIRLAMRDAAITPTPQYKSENGDSRADEVDPLSKVSAQEKPSDKEVIDGIVERQTENEKTMEGDDGDGIDDDLHRKEIAQEFHRLRARMIGRDGGFIKEEEGPITPLDGEDPGPGKRISRFKAARLGRNNQSDHPGEP